MLGLIPTTFHFTATQPSISWRSPLKWSGSHHPQKEKTEYWVCQTFHPLAIPRNSGDKEQPWENSENTDLLLVMTAMLSLWFYKVWITCKKSDTLKVWKHRSQNTLRDMAFDHVSQGVLRGLRDPEEVSQNQQSTSLLLGQTDCLKNPKEVDACLICVVAQCYTHRMGISRTEEISV